MTISYIPTSNIKEVDVEGYGVVKIRPYGAGEELQITKNIRELEDIQKTAEQFLKDIKEKYNNDESKITDDEKKQFENMQRDVARLSDELNMIVQGTISSDKPEVAQRLFNELPLSEIHKLVSMALGKGNNAEAK